MSAFQEHEMLPSLRHDDRARQSFVDAFRGHLAARVLPGNYAVYHQRVEPRFEAQHGRKPADQHEVRREMERDPFYQFWSAMQRRSQELMWESVIDSTEREAVALAERARRLSARKPRKGRRKGSLTLDPNLPIPRYHTAADIHLQPGGYHTDFMPDDVSGGAIYDRAIHIYSHGATGAQNDAMGRLLSGFYQLRFADRQPRRILDLGCAIGNSTLPWGRAYPDAELHAVDVAAPQLRYAHARAEAMGVPVHFSQQNAERTNFPDGSFDLVISHIMLHETSRSALQNIMRECHRLLVPGGVMLHLEIPRGRTPLEKFMYNWETYNNNETFAGFMTDLDLAAVAAKGGFEPARTRVEMYAEPRSADQQLYGEDFVWKILVAER